MESTSKSLKLIRCAATLLFTSVCAACSTSGSSGELSGFEAISNDSNNDVAQYYDIVSIDLVSTLLQLPELAPFYTTVQSRIGPREFGEALVNALESSGFGIQFVTGDQGNNYISYEISRVRSEVGRSTVFNVIIGDVEIEREYKTLVNVIYPYGPIEIKGANPTNVIVNNDLFLQQGNVPPFTNGVAFLDNNGDVLLTEETATKGRVVKTDFLESFNNSKYLILARAAIFTGDRIRSGDGISNKIIRTSKPIRKIHLQFRPTSFELGQNNKSGIAKMLETFDTGRDMFQITGCYHGQSLMFDGTESKALERQLRVKEELLTSGIPISNIMEEGCFGGEFADQLKPYSVILTHRRTSSIQN